MKFEDMINTIQLGDCYELIKNIPDKSIDLIIIDPPYEYTTGVGGGCFGSKERNYHEEYSKVASNKHKAIKEYMDKGLNYDKAKVFVNKEISRASINHISSGFSYELLDELDKKMKYIYIYGVANGK